MRVCGQTFAEEWEMSGFPAVAETQHRIVLRGVAVVEDTDKVLRQEMDTKLAREE